MSFWNGVTQFRSILQDETDYDSPISEELMEQIRENIEAIIMAAFYTGVSGAADSDPPDDDTGVLTDAAPGFVADVHNGRTLLITSGLAIGNLYTIDDTTATTLVCTDDNLYEDGVREADTYKIFYDIKVNLDGHDHDGVNSKSAVLADSTITQAKMADRAIGQAELKSTTAETSVAIPTESVRPLVLTGGTYSFAVQWYGDTNDCLFGATYAIADQGPITAYSTTVHFSNTDVSLARSVYIKNRYVEASGEVYWIFIKRDKTTKEVNAVSAAPDHPCYGNGGKPLLVWHPFGKFDPDTEEIICINPTKAEVKAMQEATIVEAEDQPDRSLIDVITNDYEINEVSIAKWPNELVTVGLPPNWHDAWIHQEKVTPIKKVIPKPDGLIIRSLKKKVKV